MRADRRDEPDTDRAAGRSRAARLRFRRKAILTVAGWLILPVIAGSAAALLVAGLLG